MNWLDIILVIILLKNALQGFSRGLILSAFKMVGTVVALYVGVFYRDVFMNYLRTFFPVKALLTAYFDPKPLGQSIAVMELQNLYDLAFGALAFLIIFLIAKLLFILPALFIRGIIKSSNLSFLDRVLGMVLGFGRAILGIVLLNSVVSPFLLARPESFIEKTFGQSFIMLNIKALDFITPIVVKLI